MTRDATTRVLRIYHSGVVGAWRQRDRALKAAGARTTLACARHWNEGGAVVPLDPAGDDFVVGIRTLGHHPFLFVYDPFALWTVLRSEHFDVIDIHEEPASLAAAEVQLVAWLAAVRAPFCLYSAQNIPKRYPIPFRWLEHLALRRATAVHTCNEAAGSIVRAKGFRGIVVNLGLGVDVDRFAPLAAPRCNKVLAVGYVGRLERHKGVDVLLDAIAAVGDSTATVVGDGPERAALEEHCRRLGLGLRVTFVRHAPQADLPDQYRSFDVLAVPSLETPTWIEQFGRVAVEAMASGVPVVASNSGSLPEVIGDAGVLVPAGDVHALAGALESLANDSAERRRLGAIGRERVTRYSWPNIAARQLELYREMIAAAR
jgi:glycosyltransferase involved in cell wall biosynthesis